MAVTVDPTLLPEIQRYGAFDVAACFNCGNCTAVCPLTDGDATFPRRIIRYAQVGMKAELLASKELWTCYYCGECSETCPRQAEPGEFMAAARRYAIASYDRTRLARTMYTRYRPTSSPRRASKVSRSGWPSTPRRGWRPRQPRRWRPASISFSA